MKHSAWTALALAAAITLPATAALPVGTPAPQFEAGAALDGQRIDYALASALADGAVVVYFYPAAYTEGCNLQARAFSRQHAQFLAAGASVVGVSLDGLDRLQRFSSDPDYCAGKFPVVSDADGAIARRFDLRVSAGGGDYRDTRGEAIGHGFAERTTFVVGRDGRIAATISGLGPERNVEQALAVVRGLHEGPGARRAAP